MASHRPAADLDADIARVTREARLLVVSLWTAGIIAAAAITFYWVFWLPRHPL